MSMYIVRIIDGGWTTVLSRYYQLFSFFVVIFQSRCVIIPFRFMSI